MIMDLSSKRFAYLLLALGFITTATSDKCKHILNSLGVAQGEFFKCVVEHSLDAASCGHCYSEYQLIYSAYSNLTSDKNCSDQVLNSNRFSFAYTVQKSVKDIWEKGFCNDCFDANNSMSSTHTEFQKLQQVLTNCVNTAPTNSTCSMCKSLYVDLNKFYRRIDEEKKGQVCFDDQIQINRTRLEWSKVYKCCEREYSLIYFLICSSIFCVLPLIFYFGMWGYTRRTERNHGTIDYSDIAHEHGVAEPSSSNSLNPRADDVPTTSQNSHH